MALFERNRTARKHYWDPDPPRRQYWSGRENWRWRDRRWYYPRSSRKQTFRCMLRDLLIRLVAFVILSALALAWLKFHFLDGQF
jgi:hypothetical protein